MPGLEKNRIYRACIQGYSSEGLGIARIDGQVVFVHGAIRGEICDVLVMKVLKNAAFGKIAALVEPSPARRVPDCPYYGRCGGCDFRHMSYEEELWAKRARVQDALTRIGGAEVTVEEILGAEQPLHYRNKSIYPISPAGEVGFYRARSHQVVDVEHCLIQKPEADALAQAVRDYIARFQVEPYNEATGRGLLRHLYVRTGSTGESLVCLLVNGSRLPHEQELVDMLLSTPNIEQRTVGIGRLDPEIARDFSNVGPMVRASGHARDTRADHPFVGYGLLPMTVHSEQGCDVISRLKVRINEVFTALNMIDFGLDNLPGGPLMVEGFTYIPNRFALGFAEAPRGDDIHWSMTGDNQKLYRWRCRAATYANWPTLRYMLRGNTVSDAPLIIGSLDPCYSCTDRMTVVDVRKKKSQVVPYKELERYSIERKNSPLK